MECFSERVCRLYVAWLANIPITISGNWGSVGVDHKELRTWMGCGFRIIGDIIYILVRRRYTGTLLIGGAYGVGIMGDHSGPSRGDDEERITSRGGCCVVSAPLLKRITSPKFSFLVESGSDYRWRILATLRIVYAPSTGAR